MVLHAPESFWKLDLLRPESLTFEASNGRLSCLGQQALEQQDRGVPEVCTVTEGFVTLGQGRRYPCSLRTRTALSLMG